MYEAVESSDHAPPPPAAAAAASFIHNNLPADSWTQTLLMGGLAANEEEDKLFTQNHLQFLPAFSTNLHPTSHQFSTGRVAKRPKIQHSSSKTTTTIKVRKEKLGDRITALHQLVSPFGKTDTATVLLEAIGYIKFLEKQIQALSVPYMGHGHGSAKNMGHEQQHHECDGEEGKKSLRSRGLCLVPISCTLENGSADYYWAPMHN